MSYQLKDLYSPAFYERFSGVLEKVLTDFNKQKFIRLIFDKDWDARELKDRLWHTSIVMNQFFPDDFEKAGPLILTVVETLRADNFMEASLEFMFLPDYVERYGLDHFDVSVKVFEELTIFTSCEFAVRPFIVKYPDKMMKIVEAWSRHGNEHVRRLASEGSRSRLPWAMALPEFKKDPAPVLPVLENLKTDESEYVRRSVANNLNDIAKDNPEITLAVCEAWYGISEDTDKLVKHACRTLLKQGDTRALKLFGYGDPKNMALKKFELLTPEVAIGGSLGFTFQLENIAGTTQKVRLEYCVYYQKANGTLSGKVFKISEKSIDPEAIIDMERKQSFKLISTRKYHKGAHEISIVINGEEKGRKGFVLV
jgi:3-methyladenine DNA glycosylase AlkC